MGKAKIQYFRPAGLNGVELLSCQDSQFDFPHHFHQAYCIWFNGSGGEHYSHRGNTDILQPGEFGIVAPGEVHANRAFNHSTRNLMTFYVQPEQLQDVARQIGDQSSFDIEFRSRFYRDPQCLQMLGNLFRILRNSASTLERESAFLEVFSLLTGRHATAKPQPGAIGNEKKRVAQVIELFHDRLAENLSLEELARRFDCTPFHLIRFFKKQTGLTPYAYLLRLRLERARELIWKGFPLVEVAMATGFSDQSHLNRHFKALFGLTPGQCRLQSLRH